MGGRLVTSWDCTDGLVSRTANDGVLIVIPAQAGIQRHCFNGSEALDPRLRGDDDQKR